MAINFEFHNVTVTGEKAWCSCGGWEVHNHPCPRTAGFLHIMKARDKRRAQYLKEREDAHTV